MIYRYFISFAKLKLIIIQSILWLVMCLFSTPLLSQKFDPQVEFKCTKLSDQSRILNYRLKINSGNYKDNPSVIGIPILFYDGGKSVCLKTNEKGEVAFTIPKHQNQISTNRELTYYAFIGDNKTVKSKKDSIKVVDLILEMNPLIRDSVKTIGIKSYEIDPKGNKIPVRVNFDMTVSRTFSDYKIAESSTNENGVAEIEFLKEIPGDQEGNIRLIARVEDHKKYGTIEKTQTIKWGVPTNFAKVKIHRALWTSIAPTWMIVTLTILLSGVWLHYAYIMYKMYRIKNENK